MSLEKIKDRAALVAAEVSMVNDDVMQADLSFGQSELAMELVLDAIAAGVSGLKGVLKHCKGAAVPLGFAHGTLQDKQKALLELGLQDSGQEVARDVPERLGTLVTRVGSYAYATAELHRSVDEVSKELRASLEKVDALRRAFQETQNNTGGDVVVAFNAYEDATEAFMQEY